MVSVPMRYVEHIKAKGKSYYYYRRDGRRWPLEGTPGSRAFIRSYNKVDNGFGGAAGPLPGTYDAIASEYLKSSNFRKFIATSRCWPTFVAGG